MIITIPRGLVPWLPLTYYVLLYILFIFMFCYFLHIVPILPHPSQKVVMEITHVYSSIVLRYYGDTSLFAVILMAYTLCVLLHNTCVAMKLYLCLPYYDYG